MDIFIKKYQTIIKSLKEQTTYGGKKYTITYNKNRQNRLELTVE